MVIRSSPTAMDIIKYCKKIIEINVENKNITADTRLGRTNLPGNVYEPLCHIFNNVWGGGASVKGGNLGIS